MSCIVNKDTHLYGSFSIKAGNNGCKTFNEYFKYYNINALYKSFSVNDIGEAIEAAKTLDFKGFAVSMPFKKSIIPYLDNIDKIVTRTESCNTVIIDDGLLSGYNTDYLAVKEYLGETKIIGDVIYILGEGGFSSSVKYAIIDLGLSYKIINRLTWESIYKLNNCTIFNCTPLENILINGDNVLYINGVPTSKDGINISKIQAKYQFELYTNKKFPL